MQTGPGYVMHFGGLFNMPVDDLWGMRERKDNNRSPNVTFTLQKTLSSAWHTNLHELQKSAWISTRSLPADDAIFALRFSQTHRHVSILDAAHNILRSVADRDAEGYRYGEGPIFIMKDMLRDPGL